MNDPRQVTRTMVSLVTSDGAGVTLRRSVGTAQISELDPFLLLDAFGTDNPDDYIAGFPDHPHRGFETVTYMIAGHMRHRDSTGAEGVLVPGGVQWMTAGRGIVHSEMPEQSEGEMRGFQLWVNLPSSDKMCPPRYQNFEPADVPEAETATGARLRVIAGRGGGAEGPVEGIAVDPLYMDVTLDPGGRHAQDVAPGHACFAYVFEGTAEIGGTAVEAHTLAVLGEGDGVELASAGGGRLMLAAARPIGEPVVRYGPFVMNTRHEIQQAIEDFQGGRF
ncbi:MAG: pirin family protein [Rhodospirillales bacterium]|nr:pirin family protein [Rhodospirillales bacterium]MDP6773416.1 pirin family protein [Rhodospirillales bacterium]